MQKVTTQNPVSHSKIWLTVILAITLLLAIAIWKYFDFKIEKVKQNNTITTLLVTNISFGQDI
jgi:hypothetical protein